VKKWVFLLKNSFDFLLGIAQAASAHPCHVLNNGEAISCCFLWHSFFATAPEKYVSRNQMLL